MGLDFASKVITYFKADVSDLKSGLRELQGEEKKLAQAQLDAAKERNEGLESWVKGLGNANQALELVGKAVEFGKDAFKEYADDLRMRAAAGTADIEALKKASLGLRSEDELLAFAAKTQHGMYKLTQEQMELAQKAMVGLTRAGFDQKEVVDKVTEALVSGKTRGLKEFGIAVKATGDETESLNAIMGELATKANGVDEGTQTAAEGVQSSAVTMGDAFNNMKQAIGELVAALAPLIGAFAKAVEGVAGVVSWALKLPSVVIGAANGDYANPSMLGDYVAGLDAQAAARDAAAASAKNSLYNDPNYNPFGNPYEQNPLNYRNFGDAAGVYHQNAWEQDTGAYANGSTVDEGALYTFSNGVLKKLPKQSKGGGKGGNYFGGGSVSDYASVDGSDRVGKPIGFGDTQYNSLLQNGVGGDFGIGDSKTKGDWADTAKLSDEQLKAYVDSQNKFFQGLKGIAAANKAEEKSFLESHFGKLEQFDAYATAFGMLSGAITTSMDAWITGSMGAADAIKKFIGEQLKAEATSLAIQALKHGAWAIGSLAFGDFAGAAAHGIAAGEFGAAAAAAAVAAREFGHGGADYGKSGGAKGGSAGGSAGKSDKSSGSSGGGGGDGRQGHDTTVFIYSDSFSDSSESQRRRTAEKMLSRATGGKAYSNS
jgi:hypothetical protein